MRCYKCGSKLQCQQTNFIATDNEVMRRKVCKACGIVYITVERIEYCYEKEKEQRNLESIQASY